MSSLGLLNNWTHYPRPRRVAQALVCLWILALADLCLTMWARRFTPFIELNPIADVVLGMGFGALVCYKLATTMVGTMIFWGLRHHSRSEVMLWGLVGVYVLLALRWSQYTHGAVASITLAQ